MAKKGASNSGSGKTNARAHDQARAAHLPPAPATWNPRPDINDGGMNKGARSKRAKMG